MGQTFTDVQPIGGAQTFSNVVPIMAAGVPRPNVPMAAMPLSPIEQGGADVTNKIGGMASHAATFGKDTANDVYDVSTPNIATQLYRHVQGLPNTLDKIPAKAVAAFFTASGLPEGEVSAGAKAGEEAAIPSRYSPPENPATAAASPEPIKPTPSGANIPRTLSGDAALRQILTGQDTDNLLKIAKSRGINVTQESQLRPGIAGPKLINKIVDDFSDDELDGLRSQFLENTRMGRHDFGDIGAEANKTLAMQSYFPDVKVSAAQLKRTQAAIAAARPQATAAAPPAEDDDNLLNLLQESLRRVNAGQVTAHQ